MYPMNEILGEKPQLTYKRIVCNMDLVLNFKEESI